ncbi:MAG TPA: HPF/RaiA family ribosome-associated protein [Polyangiaceae bacterium]
MQIQINTDSNVEGRERLAAYVNGVVEDALGRFRERLTQVELHLRDNDGHKGSLNHKSCMMSARLKGRQPIVVTNQGATMNDALSGAIDKLKRSLESEIDRLQEHR